MHVQYLSEASAFQLNGSFQWLTLAHDTGCSQTNLYTKDPITISVMIHGPIRIVWMLWLGTCWVKNKGLYPTLPPCLAVTSQKLQLLQPSASMS